MRAIVYFERHPENPKEHKSVFERHLCSGFLGRLHKGPSDPGRDMGQHLLHRPLFELKRQEEVRAMYGSAAKSQVLPFHDELLQKPDLQLLLEKQ